MQRGSLQWKEQIPLPFIPVLEELGERIHPLVPCGQPIFMQSQESNLFVGKKSKNLVKLWVTLILITRSS